MRNDEQEHRGGNQDTNRERHDRVGHRGLHLAAQFHLGLDGVGKPHQHCVEHTADLTRAHHRDVQTAEHLRVLRDRGGQRNALLDVEAHFADDAREFLVLGLLRQDRQRSDQGEARVDHHRELTGKDRDVLHLHPGRHAGDLDVALQLDLSRALRLDRDRRVAHLPQLADDERGVLGVELTFDELPGLVAYLVREGGCHQAAHPAPTFPADCTSRRRSSSLEQRSSAVSMVTLRCETSVARFWSIVTIPHFAPVCIKE